MKKISEIKKSKLNFLKIAHNFSLRGIEGASKQKTMNSKTFEYDKQKTIQALRYHFITRKEIKVMMILVNVFAIFSAALFFFKKISPIAFLLSSFLWVMMMILFWFLLPRIIYKKSPSFKQAFKVSFTEVALTLETGSASRSFNWKEFSTWMESPHFIHLYFSSKSFFLIPKDALTEELDVLRKLCKEKIAPKTL